MVAISKEVKKVRNSKVYTFEEYLRREEKAVEKHEFYNGKIIRMSEGAYIHSLISSNMITAFNIAIAPLPRIYYVHGSEMKIRIESTNIGVYPDALVICEKHEFWQDRTDVIVNPLLIVEVLSPSTQAYDRLGKFELYKLLPSFQEYVFVNADKYSVETRFQEETDLWRIKTETDIDSSINIRSLGITIPMADIYKKIVFSDKK